LVIYLETYIQI